MITRGEQMLALRRRRMAQSPAFLRGGFRPFFFGGAAWALLALAWWLCSLAGVVTLLVAIDPLAWHRHEMLFGFVGAVVAGFLLTAIPNWTGRLPIAGAPLAALFGLWLAGRIALLFSGLLGQATAAAFDVAFPLVIAAVGAQEVIAAKNRNLPVVAAVLLLAGANALDHAAMAGLVADPLAGVRLAIGVISVLIALVGGRIIPSFTRNWLVKRKVTVGLPTQPGRFDLAAITATAAALLLWTALPNARLTGLLLALAGALQLLRLLRWRGVRTVADPLVFMLHVAFAWLPAGLLLLGASILRTDVVPQSAAVHALTAGAMGSMILAVMTRASLGHTARELRADGATCLLYLLVTGGALARVAAPLLVHHYTGLMRTGALLWGAAFFLFLLRYAPVLFAPRKGERA
ncbi:NnrS family protein [Sphingomonas sp. BN140010]|uniref:NnrS family protein n=1 Tax=Sphingomonas arvum TaxID=2992113 RepID=A0ABT3JBZ1_9SPHN|nr:NnrS family protein [Sphingomonas sp. BN140010]MCW3796546.1 NnrS family protein [Sphingomonas sp. BN140010]